MATSAVQFAVEADVSGLSKGVQQAKGSLTQLGSEVQKTSNKTKTFKQEIRGEEKELEKLKTQYLNLGRAQNSAYGRDLLARMTAAKVKINEMTAANAKLTASIEKAAIAQKGFLASMKNSLSSLSMVGGPVGSLASMASMITPQTAAIAGAAAVTVGAVKNTLEYHHALNDLQIDFGITAEEAKKFGEAARNVGKDFGIGASEMTKHFQEIGDQLPQLRGDVGSIEQVAEAVSTLAKGMGVDFEQAANAAVTVMSKFNMSANEASHVVNVLAEASKNSGANMDYFAAVFDKAGAKASTLKISFEDVAAATSVLASNFDEAQTSTGLTMLFDKLAKQANNDFNPAVVGLAQAIQNLTDANLSYAEASDLVGRKAVDVLNHLTQNNAAFQEQAKKIMNTNAAYDAFGIKNEELGEKINRLKAIWEDLLITIGESEFFSELIDLFGTIVDVLGEISDALNNLGKTFDDTGEKAGISFNPTIMTLKIVEGILKFLGDLVKLLCFAFTDSAKDINDKWNDVSDNLSDTGWLSVITGAFGTLFNVAKDVIGTIIGWINELRNQWNNLMNTIDGGNRTTSGGNNGVSGGGKGNNTPDYSGHYFYKKKGNTGEYYDDAGTTIPKGYAVVGRGPQGQVIIDKVKVGGSGGGGRSGGKIHRGGGRSGGGAPKKTGPTFEADSEAAFEDNIRKWNAELKNQNLDLDAQEGLIIKIINAEKELNKIRKEREGIKADYEIGDRFGFDIVDEYKKATGNSHVDPDFFKDVSSKDEAKKKIQDFLDALKPKLPVEPELKKPEKLKVEDIYDSKLNLAKSIEDEINKLRERQQFGLIEDEEFENKLDILQRIADENGITLPVELLVNQKKMENFKDTIDGVSNAVSSLGANFTALGQATQEPVLNIAGIIAEAIANITRSFGEAMAKDTSSKSFVWTWIAAALAGTATLISVISQIKSAQGYAEGGIISGSTTVGDRIMARVNAGEMILNKRQQKNLFNMLDNGTRINYGGTFSFEKAIVKGSDIELAVKNYNKVRGKK